jgi:hypothetical protein
MRHINHVIRLLQATLVLLGLIYVLDLRASGTFSPSGTDFRASGTFSHSGTDLCASGTFSHSMTDFRALDMFSPSGTRI